MSSHELTQDDPNEGFRSSQEPRRLVRPLTIYIFELENRLELEFVEKTLKYCDIVKWLTREHQ